jgi:pimeloyl-ACP methyl ester carboxylesterase
MIGDLRQVRSYLMDPGVRATAQAEVGHRVTEDTRVLVGHSLGSVVAYEVLCAHTDWPVRVLVTLGSPLGMRHLIYDRLEPPPRQRGSVLEASWPGPVTAWTNIADAGDVVAAVEDLRPLFGERVQQIRVHNGPHAHDMRPYLTDPATGAVIAAGLDD